MLDPYGEICSRTKGPNLPFVGGHKSVVLRFRTLETECVWVNLLQNTVKSAARYQLLHALLKFSTVRLRPRQFVLFNMNHFMEQGSHPHNAARFVFWVQMDADRGMGFIILHLRTPYNATTSTI